MTTMTKLQSVASTTHTFNLDNIDKLFQRKLEGPIDPENPPQVVFENPLLSVSLPGWSFRMRAESNKHGSFLTVFFQAIPRFYECSFSGCWFRKAWFTLECAWHGGQPDGPGGRSRFISRDIHYSANSDTGPPLRFTAYPIKPHNLRPLHAKVSLIIHESQNVPQLILENDLFDLRLACHDALFDNPLASDIVLAPHLHNCSSSMRIYASSDFLSRRSQYFSALFSSDSIKSNDSTSDDENHRVVDIQVDDIYAFKCLIRYLYSMQIQFKPLTKTVVHTRPLQNQGISECSALSIYRLADIFKVQSLKDFTFQYIEIALICSTDLCFREATRAASLLSNYPELYSLFARLRLKRLYQQSGIAS
ncbi:hypothetical protein NEOLI_004570 [Neolecta irregularis DAH-3]|uniref:BTB domain-containing protein n=1 Tax=Neolecta irregularis (strain DAH-3) TaxID=1198029 RepID=A0A1U7LLC4_NEOID|nr:hypothetical protein NEOLI_004570 [Neolecta irregularis DAH-3]|eukprot:OLL23466.1 hypothetical protein NEOLI_004570 [Neolecta irregularis DAH-3]